MAKESWEKALDAHDRGDSRFTSNQIERAAAAAAEKANGGKFNDPLFYAPEHRIFWREVVRTALEAASA